MSVEHYENFPVASVLCPRSIRPAVVAIYRYARAADDLADEGDAPAGERLADLAAYRDALLATLAGRPPPARWAGIFGPLGASVEAFGLPRQPLLDLLDAFMQDARNPVHADRNSLLDYCRRSANPIGRLLLHLHGVDDALSLQRSDAVCTALQLINFWQDLGVDVARGRHYVPDADLTQHGLRRDDLQPGRDDDRTRALVRSLCAWAAETMYRGAPLALQLPGRAGWELRLVVQGGLRVLERIERHGHAALTTRPTVRPTELPLLLWRAAAMRAPAVPR